MSSNNLNTASLKWGLRQARTELAKDDRNESFDLLVIECERRLGIGEIHVIPPSPNSGG